MQPEIAQQLIELNHLFYQTFADDFSATRQRLQPGVLQAVKLISRSTRLLDLGCGNGQLAQYLSKNGHTGPYIGLDNSNKLIGIAAQQQIRNAHFFSADLTGQTWTETLPPTHFEAVVCFAVMHHIPSASLRLEFLKKVYQILTPEGHFILSNWQFLNSPKLRSRIQPWEKIGLTAEMVDEHDYLLDWRRGGAGFRYVHFYTSPELHTLADQAGFAVLDEFSSDGTGGNLGLYQIWQPIIEK